MNENAWNVAQCLADERAQQEADAVQEILDLAPAPSEAGRDDSDGGQFSVVRLAP